MSRIFDYNTNHHNTRLGLQAIKVHFIFLSIFGYMFMHAIIQAHKTKTY